MDNLPFQRLLCGVQKYDWGMKGTNLECKVFEIFHQAHQQYKYKDDRNTLNKNDHYAEIWIGNHPSLPSVTKDYDRIQDNMSFLMKVLSVEKPLSIQIHPNKEQAAKLHKAHPKIYPDANHKPEMAIAITEFHALLGFLPKEQIIQNLTQNPKIIYYLGEGQWNNFKNSNQDVENLKSIVSTILQWPENILIEIFDKIQLPNEVKQIIKVPMESVDIGYVFVLMMNYVKLQPGQSVFIPAGYIHAYLYGNCIEAMANSDNVIRCGLTPKLKDIPAMIEVLDINLGAINYVEPQIHKRKGYITKTYQVHLDDFICISHHLDKQLRTEQFPATKNAIILCLKGAGSLGEEGNPQHHHFASGETILVSRACNIYIQSLEDLVVFICEQKQV